MYIEGQRGRGRIRFWNIDGFEEKSGLPADEEKEYWTRKVEDKSC